MTVNQIIRTASAYAGVKPSVLAESVGWSPQNLNKRLTTGKLSIDEWAALAEALGGKLNLYIEFPDGEKYGIK